MDGYTLAQGELFMREANHIELRRRVLLAEAIVARAFDDEAWKQITRDL